ncbi:hypothetical protein K402DRAFT_392414 [Aulographum hederae CBS 113979]|uniref:rhomboid protease n=1 Tax=Aulographum hederae CBS 113979 TaxID=1176131 RepID=A0A6G1H357_9PEZI|nr:hypothetical protein K402DRAFT_392414 [Aulographum hederae CBS 113979]
MPTVRQSLLSFNPRTLRSYMYRIPLCTRGLLLLILVLYLASIPLPWIVEYGALKPSLVSFGSMVRLSTFPLVHNGFFHVVLNLLALAPLLERFEAEYGTLVTFILFTGPFSTIPGGIYTLVERFIFHWDTAVCGSSIWIFLLLASESLSTSTSHPTFTLSTLRIPTWTTPLILSVLLSFLLPKTSLLGHLAGCAIGYLWGLSYIKFLVPPEKILRWIEGKLDLMRRLPHYVSVDRTTYGRYGVLPSSGVGVVSGGMGAPVVERADARTPLVTLAREGAGVGPAAGAGVGAEAGVGLRMEGTTQRLGP